MPICVLKEGGERVLKEGHPWIRSQAIAKAEAEAGDCVQVLDSKGRFLAQGHYNPHSPLAVRILTWERERVDRAFFRRRLEEALALRAPLLSFTEAVRLVNGEGDLMPGLVVDRYGRWLALQVHTPGMERIKDLLVGLLKELLPLEGIYDKSDPDARKGEGLPPSQGVLWGEVPEVVEVKEGDLRLLVDLKGGQKTGLYLDQRDNRGLVRGLAKGKKVLDCFCYTGGFTLSALRGGAKGVKAVDSSSRALELLRENIRLNGLPQDRCVVERADAFDFLRAERGKYDLIVLDPPPFARSRREISRALKGYEELNRLAMRLLKRGGLLLTCCCTQRVSREEFYGAVLEASRTVARGLQLLSSSRAPLDHPVWATHPEGDYFKAFLFRVL